MSSYTDALRMRLDEFESRKNLGLPIESCVECGERFSPKNVFTKDGARETQISGLCERCFDAICAEEPNE